MILLNIIKARCGIPESITVYDDGELVPLVADAIEDMKTAGVPERMLPESASADAAGISPRVVTAITLYVQGMRGQDRTDTAKYMKYYKDKLHKLMLEPEGEG